MVGLCNKTLFHVALYRASGIAEIWRDPLARTTAIDYAMSVFDMLSIESVWDELV